MLTLCLCGEFLLYIRCCVHFYAGSVSYTSRAGFIMYPRVSLTHPVLASFLFVCFCFIWGVSLTLRVLVFSFIAGVSLTHIIFNSGVSLTHPVLALILSGDFYTSHAVFISGEFLLHIPCWLCFYVGSFSYTSRADFVFMWGVSLTHPVLPSIFCGELFFLASLCTQGDSLTLPVLVRVLIVEVSLNHPELDSFLFGEFLLHIPCWLHIYLGSFSYTSRAGFNFIMELLHIPCCLYFYRRSFSYTSHADFVFRWGGFLRHPVLP